MGRMSLSRPEVISPPTVEAQSVEPAPVRRIRHQARDAALSAAVSLAGSVGVVALIWAVISWLS